MNPLEFINEKLAIAEKATPGPWDTVAVMLVLDRAAEGSLSDDQLRHDGQLISDARGNYAKVLRALQQAVLTLEEYKRANEHAGFTKAEYALAAIEKELG